MYLLGWRVSRATWKIIYLKDHIFQHHSDIENKIESSGRCGNLRPPKQKNKKKPI